MIRKLQRKFIAVTMLSVTLVLLAMGIAINVICFVSAESDLNATLQLIAGNSGTLPSAPPNNEPGGPGQGHFTPETPYSTRYFVLRFHQDGTLDTADLDHIAAVTQEQAQSYASLAAEKGTGTGYTGSYKYLIVKNGEDRYMAVFLDCSEKLHTLRVFIGSSVAVIMCSEGMILALVLLLSRRAIAPVAESLEKQKQFITNASHELKTPLTVIGTSLKLLEMDTGSTKWTGKIQLQVDKLTSLVGQLVSLSRMDEERPPLRMAEFDLSAAVQETAESFRDNLQCAGHALQLEIQPDILYCGDEYALRQLVSILLDNAGKYTASGGTVSLCLRQEKKHIVLTQQNPCSDALQPDRLFDRFYRADESHSTQTPGFGLGLSIARGIVLAHKSTIRCSCPQPDTLLFTVQLRK